MERPDMRLLLGMILGAILTVAFAYSYDSMQTSSVATGPAAGKRTMVNWDVVEANWNSFKVKAQTGWTELKARVDRS
jgi:hypothetical protein